MPQASLWPPSLGVGPRKRPATQTRTAFQRTATFVTPLQAHAESLNLPVVTAAVPPVRAAQPRQLAARPVRPTRLPAELRLHYRAVAGQARLVLPVPPQGPASRRAVHPWPPHRCLNPPQQRPLRRLAAPAWQSPVPAQPQVRAAPHPLSRRVPAVGAHRSGRWRLSSLETRPAQSPQYLLG